MILLTVLLEVYKETINDSRVSEQIEQQMNAVVLQGQYFGVLHNDVRYPRYIERRKSDVLLELNAKDATMAADKLARLKAFVEGFQQLKACKTKTGRFQSRPERQARNRRQFRISSSDLPSLVCEYSASRFVR